MTVRGNDILKRVRRPETEKNLRAVFSSIQSSGAVVIFTGVTRPLNSARDKSYENICKEMGVHYIAEILDGIKGSENISADPVHPNCKGYKIMAELREENLL